jgi:phenylacetate-CoA ligase
MIWNSQFEAMKRSTLDQVKLERLQSTLNRVYSNVAFYKHSFDSAGIDIENVKSLSDIKCLPFTTKEDLRKSYPYDMFAVPLRDIVRIHSTAGRSGKPIAIGYTKNDVAHWSELTARVFAAAGVNEQDFVQIAFDYSMFTGAFGLHYGAEKLGASVIPSSSMTNIRKQILIMKDYKTSVLVGPPSYASRILDNLKAMNIHPEELHLKIGIFGTEPWNDEKRYRIERDLRITAFNCYGINEMMGPGVSCECEARNGLHVNEDHFIVEIINPETLEPLQQGQEGELVITTITREGFPLVRYRSGDISILSENKCGCGRTTMRMSQVASRSDDLIVVGGVNVFPSQIDEAMSKFGIDRHQFSIIVKKKNDRDIIELKIKISELLFGDEIKKLLELKHAISLALESDLGVSVETSLVEGGPLDGPKKFLNDRILDER